MKKQRILALALAASTAVSVFGGFSASAATGNKADEKFVAYTTTAVAELQAADDTVDEILGKLDKIYTGSASLDLAIEQGTAYLFDYVVASDKDGKLDEDAYAATGYAKDADIKASLIDAIGKAYGAEDSDLTVTVKAQLNALIREFNDEYTIAGINYTIKNEFDTYAALAAKLDSADYQDLYDADDKEWDAYELAALKAAFATASTSLSTAAPAATSQLIYLINSFETIDSVIGLDRAASDEEKYDELLASVDDLIEADYTEASWNKLLAKMDVAATYASYDDYATALKELQAGIDGLVVNKPSTTELKAVLDSLYVDSYTTGSNVKYAGDDKEDYVYLKNNNLVNGNPSYAWNCAFYDSSEGTGYYDSYGDKYTTSAFEVASDMYYNITRRANSGKYTQTKVDEAVADLEYAVSQLSEGGAGANWELVRLEELVEKAEAIVETDYRTTRTAWKNFVAALEDAQDVLAESAPTSTKINRVYDALKDALDGLDAIALAPSAANKTTLKALLTEAKTLLKNMDGKVLAQVTALEDAVEAGDAAYKAYSTKKVSEIDTIIADLESAIAGYTQKQGWYFENNVWYYGKGATTVKGWLNDNGTWYYLDPTTGAMKTGWQKIDNVWYLFKTGTGSGKMLTGWQKDGNTWYYLNSNGSMATGWAKINNVWYYFQPSGAMVSNTWAWVGDKCYYFYASGAMAANTTIDGYKVDASGAWVK